MADQPRSAWSEVSRDFFRSLRSWLDALSSARTWQLLILSMIAIAIGDFVARPAVVHLGPLYLLPVCLACWRLNLRIGLGVAMLAAGAVAATNFILSQHMPLAIIAWIVSEFRYSIERERVLAGRDAMTGTLNKLAFERQAERMMTAAAAEGRSLLPAFLDLDGFKTVNDRYGREAGDQVLRQFAIEERAALRRQDGLGRLGGDEFAVLVPLSSAAVAKETVERLHRRFTQALAGAPDRVTCSIGR